MFEDKAGTEVEDKQGKTDGKKKKVIINFLKIIFFFLPRKVCWLILKSSHSKLLNQGGGGEIQRQRQCLFFSLRDREECYLKMRWDEIF